ncbi:MAG: hypothetical protein ACK55I_44920, partial [bacterium]
MVPNPAAIMSGVEPSAFGICGSPPNSTNNLRKGRSAVSAAMNTGVAPRSVTLPLPTPPFSSRKLTSAPAWCSRSTNCKLVRRPEPCGDGSPEASSPRFG